MFKCDYCEKSIGPRVPQNLTVVHAEDRDVTYTVVSIDPETEREVVRTVTGKETTAEYRACAECLGLPVNPEYQVDPAPFFALAANLQAHGRKCKKFFTECDECRKNELKYKQIPPTLLAQSLQQPMAKVGRMSIGAVAVENLIARTLHQSKRAKLDFDASYNLLKGFQKRGGGVR